MTDIVIKSYEDFKAMTLTAARREGVTMSPNTHYFENAAALLRLLTCDNRDLLRLIRDQKPSSVAELARLTGRAEPNLFRTLEKLVAVGLVEMRDKGRCKMPVVHNIKFQIDIDPFEDADRLIRI